MHPKLPIAGARHEGSKSAVPGSPETLERLEVCQGTGYAQSRDQR